jgi:processive 1,2-diacylglycerol beta-glucosyltransferase
VKKAVAQGKIKSLGIPFDPKFNEDIPKDNLIHKLKLKLDIPNILIMGGGQGLGPIKTIIRSLEKVKREIQEIVVAGTNKKLYKSLKRRIRKYKKRILLFGYVDNINELMSISDIIITKPGGVTTAEALAKKIPMIIIKPIPGQEASNTNYLISKGAALKIDKPKDTGILIEELLADPQKLTMIRESAQRISKPNASFDIARLVLDLHK